ncbi:MAG: hypothetical protein HYU99_09445 [Deltaproteobacteria bacterium]|nr:hypothetical protein [Deltaproteobacteria bacterium]
MKTPDLKYLDTRTAQRYLKQGVLKEEEYEKFLKTLPDDAGNAADVSYEEIDAASQPTPMTVLPEEEQDPDEAESSEDQ